MARRTCALLLLFLPAGAFAQEPNQGAPLALRDVTVIDIRDGSERPNATLVIDGERVARVGTVGGMAIPAEARIVAGEGRYVIPALWDLHTHIRNREELEVIFPLLIAHGVLGIRDMGGLFPAQFKALSASMHVSPEVVAAGDMVDGPTVGTSSTGLVEPPRVSTAADGREAVAYLKERGSDFIKVQSYVPREGFFAVAEEARRHGLEVSGHIPLAVAASEASAAGLRTVEHLFEIAQNCSSRAAELRKARIAFLTDANAPTDERARRWAFPPVDPLRDTWDDGVARRLFQTFVENGTWQVPTLVLFRAWRDVLGEDYWSDPDLAYIPANWKETWRPGVHWGLQDLTDVTEVDSVAREIGRTHRLNIELVSKMHRAGVKFLAGTDVSQWNFLIPGRSVHEEMGLFVEAGLSPLEALRTATLHPATYLALEDSFGTVERGKVANLLLLDEDPRVDIRNTRSIAAVIARGTYLDRGSLDRILDQVRERANR